MRYVMVCLVHNDLVALSGWSLVYMKVIISEAFMC